MANESNSVMVQPSGKIEAYDGLFFKPNEPYNQGNIYDFSEDDFISSCEEAIKRYESSQVNENGLKLQEDFSLDKTLDKLSTNYTVVCLFTYSKTQKPTR